MEMTAAPLHVQRLALLRDGTSVGCFTLRSHETRVVVMEPNGHAYTHAGPSGRLSRHLTPTLVSAHREMVATTMRFRNRYLWCAVDANAEVKLPYVHSAVGDAAVSSRRRRRQPNMSPCWPQLESYVTSRLWNDHEKAFEMESLDGTARVALHASGKLVDVQFLIEIKHNDDSSSSDALYTRVWQCFPVASTPACFSFPVRVLLRARIARGSRTDSFRVDNLDDLQSTVALPRNGVIDARPTFRPLFHDAPGASITHTVQANEVESVEAVARWIKGLSRSLDRCVAVEQNDAVELLVVNAAAVPTVLILAAQSDTNASSRRSVIECERHFFRAFDADGAVTQQFTVETLPLGLETLSRDFRRTTAVLQYAAELFRAASTHQPSRRLHQETPDDKEASTSSTTAMTTELLEDVSNEMGRFRAFSDGRVRVVFADRTILQVFPSLHGQRTEDCSFVDRDGLASRCTSDSASETQQRYIAMALDFSQWAFATPEQRFRRHQLQLEQRQLVAQELHKISIRQELNRNADPSGRDTSHSRGGIARQVTSHLAEESLTREAIVHLQQETQRHMTHIRALLHGATDTADTHRD